MKKNMRIMQKICFLLLFSIPIIPAWGRAEGVQARYLENSGSRSVLELIIEDPAPSSIIVKQHIPQGIKVQSASPVYTKIAVKKNELKWLFKQPRPGVQRIILEFASPLPGKGLTAVIRCKSPIDGTLMTTHVQ